MLQRFRRALEAARSATAEAETSEVRQAADAASGPQPPDDGPQLPEPEPLLALLALDEVGPPAEDAKRRHLADARDGNTRALFVLSTQSELDFRPEPDLICEFLPSHEDIYRATMERADVITLYRLYRLRLILDKWRVRECRWIGESAEELVARFKSETDAAKRPIRFRQL